MYACTVSYICGGECDKKMYLQIVIKKERCDVDGTMGRRV
jgi:hypothetical protein